MPSSQPAGRFLVAGAFYFPSLNANDEHISQSESDYKRFVLLSLSVFHFSFAFFL